MNKGYVSNEMFAGRLSAHGQITDLSSGFKLDALLPFSIFIIPKSVVSDGVIVDEIDPESDKEIGLIVNCRTYQNADTKPLPVMFYDWTPGAIMEIAADAIDLDTYYVYWGCGQTINPAS
jgi:hypothetical protein